MSDIFNQDTTFKEMGLSADVLKGVDAAGFEYPTEIQAALIPRVLAGHDVMGQAKTGTGKTAAFGLPMLTQADPDTPMQALVLTPTRELAAQVAAELDQFARHTAIRTTCIIGGESMRHQQKSLEEGGHIMVGTPGRVMDLHGRGMISFDKLRWVALDEVDRMLDIGFRDDIKKILGGIRQDHQTIFVSATIDQAIERLARQFMTADAQKVNVVSGSLTVSQVDQKYLAVEAWDKRALLLKLFRAEKPDTTIVFCKTKATVRKITQYLRDKQIEVREIHGDLHQSKRNKVMEALRRENVDVLVASDLAARGLDVDHITHVINYDLPEDPEIYIHRVGRTARAGRRGVAWSFVTPEQGQMLTEIEKLTGVEIEKLEYPDFVPGRVPDDVAEERTRDRARLEKQPADPSRAITADPNALDDAQLKAMFPDGNIPTSMPRRTLGSRMKRRGR